MESTKNEVLIFIFYQMANRKSLIPFVNGDVSFESNGLKLVTDVNATERGLEIIQSLF